MVNDIQAFSVCRLLAKLEGLLVGGSGGAVLFSCLKIALLNNKSQIIVGIIPDSGITYLNTIYNNEWLENRSLILYESLNEIIEACLNESEFYSKGSLIKNEIIDPNKLINIY